MITLTPEQVERNLTLALELDVRVLPVDDRARADAATWAFDAFDEAAALECHLCELLEVGIGHEYLDNDRCPGCGSHATRRVIIDAHDRVLRPE